MTAKLFSDSKLVGERVVNSPAPYIEANISNEDAAFLRRMGIAPFETSEAARLRTFRLCATESTGETLIYSEI